MATIDVKDAAGNTVPLEKPLAAGRAAAAASRPVALSNEDAAALAQLHTDLGTTLAGFLDGLEALIGTTNSGNAAILAKLSADPATQTTLAALLAKVSPDQATQTTLAAILAKMIAAPSTSAKQDSEIAAIGTVGTRAYGTSVARLAYAGASAASTVITGTEVLLHNCGTARCYVKSGSGTPVATANDIPIEAGEKFHLRITTGDKIAAIQDSFGGNLNIVPVA
jgi:hypothetical protein